MRSASSRLVISLDFELLWGSIKNSNPLSYSKNVEGEWVAIPRMRNMFKRYGISVTWATVGMLMCKDYAQWQALTSTLLPNHPFRRLKSCSIDSLVRQYPRLFFARPLVEQVLSHSEHELASHTFSHFLCNEEGATNQQLKADLVCANYVASEIGVVYRSFVFPQNQIRQDVFPLLANYGIQVYRGNQDHWLYKSGHNVMGGLAGRGIRFLDSYMPLVSEEIEIPSISNGLVNVPASLFLRPWSHHLEIIQLLHLRRIKQGMTKAAQSGGIFHLWWHPHNFGINFEQNFAILESILQHYRVLMDIYGMKSVCMRDFALPNKK